MTSLGECRIHHRTKHDEINCPTLLIKLDFLFKGFLPIAEIFALKFSQEVSQAYVAKDTHDRIDKGNEQNDKSTESSDVPSTLLDIRNSPIVPMHDSNDINSDFEVGIPKMVKLLNQNLLAMGCSDGLSDIALSGQCRIHGTAQHEESNCITFLT